MAEFCNVMRQAARMCAQQNNSCEGCSLYDDGIECPVEGPPEGWKLNMLAEYERIVMDWAAANPEPKYPTWNEVWKQLFPESHYAACPGYFLNFDRVERYCGIPHKCAICRDQPIPADIAEKLGIKPIGGKDNAE